MIFPGVGHHISITNLRCIIQIHNCLNYWQASISEPQFPHLQSGAGNTSFAVGEDDVKECV